MTNLRAPVLSVRKPGSSSKFKKEDISFVGNVPRTMEPIGDRFEASGSFG